MSAPRRGRGCTPGGCWGSWRRCSPPGTRNRSVWWWTGGSSGQWARARLRPAPPRDLVNEPSGAIGYAVPFAIAARLARPQATVVALAGDGALGFHALELETAGRCGAPVLVVVGNDAAWGTERHLQLRRYGPGRDVATALSAARYSAVVAGLGGHGEHVEEGAGLRPALERALAAVAAGRPALVDVRLRSVPSRRRGPCSPVARRCRGTQGAKAARRR